MKSTKSKWFYFAMAAIIITLISAVRLSYVETIMDVDDTSDVIFHFIVDNRSGEWTYIFNSDMAPENSSFEIDTGSILKCLSPCRIKKTPTPKGSLMPGDMRYQILIQDKTKRVGSYVMYLGNINFVEKSGEKYYYEIINSDEIIEKIDRMLDENVSGQYGAEI